MTGCLVLVTTAAVAEVILSRAEDGTRVLTNDSRAHPWRDPGSRWMDQRRGDFDEVVQIHAARASLDPDLVHSVIQVESGYDVLARSRKGAMGLMQLMPSTASELAVSDPWDAEQNVSGGTRYLGWLLEMFDGRLDWALAGYNAGPAAVQRYQGIPPYKETQAYVSRVLALYNGESPSSSAAVRVGRPVYLERTAAGGLIMTTSPPSRTSRKH